MKRFYQSEPGLRWLLNNKRAKRRSFKKIKTLRNRSFRQHLKKCPEGIKDYKMNFDYEF